MLYESFNENCLKLDKQNAKKQLEWVEKHRVYMQFIPSASIPTYINNIAFGSRDRDNYVTPHCPTPANWHLSGCSQKGTKWPEEIEREQYENYRKNWVYGEGMANAN